MIIDYLITRNGIFESFSEKKPRGYFNRSKYRSEHDEETYGSYMNPE
jgi:hypothetical protein